MPAKVEALGILLLLLPGFTCAYIIQRLAVRTALSELDKVVEALLFSFLLYLATLPVFGYALPLSWRATVDGAYQITPHYAHLVTLLLLSVIFGVLYATNINRDWLLSLFRTMGVTERTARLSIWNDTFQEIGGFVQVGFKDGKQLVGWVRYYSDDGSDCSIFLESAAWVLEDNSQEAIDGPGILLTKESAIETVSFLNWVTDDGETPDEPESA